MIKANTFDQQCHSRSLLLLSHQAENERFTHDWFLDNFTKAYSCDTTQHGYIHVSDCMLETRPIHT